MGSAEAYPRQRAALRPFRAAWQGGPIEGEASGSLAGAVLFGALAVFFLQKALRTGAKRSWGWGRTGEAAPLSRPSYAAWGLTFLVIGVGVGWEPEAAAWAWLFGACFIALLVAGVVDMRAERRRARDG